MVESIETINLHAIMIRGNGHRVLVFGNKNICIYLSTWTTSGYKVKLYIIETELKYFMKKILILDNGLPISKWIDGDHFYTNECWKFDAIKEGLSSLEWNHIKVGEKWKFMVRLLSWGNSITFTDWYYKDAGTACSSKREYILSPAIKVRLDFLEGNFQGVCKSKACEKWTVCHHYN